MTLFSKNIKLTKSNIRQKIWLPRVEIIEINIRQIICIVKMGDLFSHPEDYWISPLCCSRIINVVNVNECKKHYLQCMIE